MCPLKSGLGYFGDLYKDPPIYGGYPNYHASGNGGIRV